MEEGSREWSWSSREGDEDEAALIWAALQRLPTYARIRKGMQYSEEKGDAREVDVMNIGLADSKKLVDRLLNTAHQDNELFLLNIKPLHFEELSVDALTYVGTRALPTLRNFAANIVQGLLTKLHILPSRKKPLSVLHDLNGIIRARRMTLLLGPPKMLAELLRREKEANIKPDPDLDIFMKAASIQGQEILGLDICADTMIGNELFRGISGGEKKRVTIVKQSVHILGGTAVISLLQPAPETYQLFDDIILLSDGRIVYQGLERNVLEFFESLGFRCPDRKGVADFLQQVTSRKDQEQYWARRDQPYSFVSADQFSEAFWSFHIGTQMRDGLSVPFDKANVSREFLIMKRNSPVYIFRIFQLVVMAEITSTIFLRTEMHKKTEADGGIYLAALFFTLNVVMFNGFSDMALSILRLPVLYKQRDLGFFPVWSYSLPAWILRIPISFLDVAISAAATYYSIGFQSDIKH
ncbi:hypothetical protein SASPL_109280 [Salvia splendens]|uniref:Uncharacterized protein n=1 Tax=Salvia splendens TaxID=180675 RepID=A0A8X9A7E7_SALSN|nr:hypothetical protein SASPL_109280 [Salvia splendens]